MRYIMAVSGGVDSAVLFDMFQKDRKDFVVAHFDHGIRPESDRDAQFVRELCAKNGVKCIIGQGKLNSKVSEELAREKRYEFLKSVQENERAEAIVTAHHQDDLIETIIMNLIRGTGWRGLAPMSSDLCRPLIAWSKAMIVDYAIRNNLTWVEDETNYSADYFRNRVRTLIQGMSAKTRADLLKLNLAQSQLRNKIEDELKDLFQPELRRYNLIMWPLNVSSEVLRKATNSKLTSPQLSQVLLFARTARPGKIMQFGDDVKITASKHKINVRTS